MVSRMQAVRRMLPRPPSLCGPPAAGVCRGSSFHCWHLQPPQSGDMVAPHWTRETVNPATDQPVTHAAAGANVARKRRRAACGINGKGRRYNLLFARCRDPYLPTLVAASVGKKPSGHQQHGAARNRRATQPCVKPCAIEVPTVAIRVAQEISLYGRPSPQIERLPWQERDLAR